MAGPAVLSGMGHQSGQTLQEGERLEGEGAVAPGLAQGSLTLALLEQIVEVPLAC